MSRHLTAGFLVGAALAACLLPSARPAGEDKKGGTVRFTEHLIQDKYGYAYGVAAADLDGDGKLDLTSCDTVGNVFYWFAGDGKGGFTRHVVQDNEPGWFERHAVGDVDGDGRPDIVVVKNLAEQIVWFKNGGKPGEAGNWKRHVLATKYTRAYDVALADLTGDGKPDVAASAWKGNHIDWFENSGKPAEGLWVRHVLDEKAPEARTARVGDFNGDGRPDVLGTASAGNFIAWYENPGPGDKAWIKHVVDDRSPRPIHGHAVDMDGDGDLDVVMALGMLAGPTEKETHQVVWYENVGKPGKGAEWTKHVIGRLENAFEAVAADLNGDGKLDVVATAWSPAGKVVWFENPGDPAGEWKLHVLKEKWPLANQVIVADLDGDGKLDVIATAERGANELRWWHNEGPEKP
jgi:hypothetical protein